MVRVPKILWIFMLSRLWMLFFLVYYREVVWGGNPPVSPDQIYFHNIILNYLNLFDSYNYADIVQQGYAADRLTVFFPLLPLVTRFVVWLGIPVYVAGIVVSNICFLGSLWVFDQWMMVKKKEEKTRNAVLWLIALFPTALYWSAFYTESLFLLLTLLAFWCWEKDRKAWAYVIGGLASLSRITGVLIPIAFFVESLVKRGISWKEVGWGFVSFLLWATFPLYLWRVKGDPLLFIKSQQFYPRRSGFPLESIWVEGQNIVQLHMIHPLVMIHIGLLIWVGFYIVQVYRTYQKNELPIAETLFAIASIVVPLSTVTTLTDHIATHGFIRYILPVFPIFLYAGSVWIQWRETQTRSWIVKGKILLMLILWAIATSYCYSVLSAKSFLA